MNVEGIKLAIGQTPHWMRLAIAMVVVQALFWLVIKPMVIGTMSPDFATIKGYDYSEAGIEAPTIEAADRATFKPIEKLPSWHCCETGYRAFRYSFDLEEVPDKGLGIATAARGDNYAIYINGEFVAGAGQMELPNHTFHSMIRKAHHVSVSTLKKGRNEVTTVLVRDGIPYFDYYEPAIGEYSSIASKMEDTEFLTNGYEYLLIAALGMVALFALIFFLISGFDRGAFWLFLLAACLAASTQYYSWYDPPFGGQVRIAYFTVISLSVNFAWFAWADAWSRQSYRWLLPLACAVFFISTAAMIYAFVFQPLGEGYDNATYIMHYVGLGFSIATALRLLWNFRDLAEDRYVEAAIALLLIMVFALNALTELTQAVNLGYSVRTQPFLIIGIAVAFFARRVTLFRSSAQINSLLQGQLDERTQELAVAHDREKRLVRQQALDEERQRIMRDMHDGLGSHLMSMMMMAKRGSGQHSDYADGLQSVIDEMRLMIDSMDSVGESLRTALTVFRRRVVPKARNAGFTVEWVDNADTAYPNYSPREVLQVFRILQEAITNALKHSGGDAIEISVLPSGEGKGALAIVIADNGAGMSEANTGDERPSGRGLKNMKARAAGINAELDVQSASTGTSVSLLLSECQ